MKRLVLILLAAFACFSPLFADDSMYIDSYSMGVAVGQDNVFLVEEDIKINYLTPHHGFFRDIPVDYSSTSDVRGRVVNVEDFHCSEQWSSEYDNGYYSVRIGSADNMVDGICEYHLSYAYDIGEDVNDGYDEIYFNLVGPDWDFPIKSFNFLIGLPVPVPDLSNNVWLTRGSWGSTSSDGVHYSVSEDGKFVSGFVSLLNPGEALTIRIQLPDGYFVGARHVVNYGMYARIVFVPICLIFILAALLIRKRYKVDRAFIPVTSFNPPDGMSPMEVGYFVDGIAETKDFVSMLYYWADRGLLEIEEKDDDYLITKLKDIGYDCTLTEKYLFGEFTKGPDNGPVSLKSISTGLFDAIAAARHMIASEFKEEKSKYDRKSVRMSLIPAVMAVLLFILHSIAASYSGYPLIVAMFNFVLMLFPGIIVTVLLLVILRLYSAKKYTRSGAGNVVMWLLVALFGLVMFAVSFAMDEFNDAASTGIVAISSFVYAVTFVILCIVSNDMRSFSEYGHSKMELIVGFRDYIDKVEIDPLKRLFSENPSIFYRILPYAIVLGLEKTLSKKLEGIPIPPPSWYVGPNMSAYSVMHMAHISSMMNRELASVAASRAPSSKPGSGFGGGGFGGSGFSGGGFGGGGGRGW